MLDDVKHLNSFVTLIVTLLHAGFNHTLSFCFGVRSTCWSNCIQCTFRILLYASLTAVPLLPFHSFVFPYPLFHAVHLRLYPWVCALCLLSVRRTERARRSCHVTIKLFGTVTSLPLRTDGGSWTSKGSDRRVDRSIHHDHAGLTQQKMECWERPLSCEGPGNSKQYFLAPVRLSNKGGRYMNYLALM